MEVVENQQLDEAREDEDLTPLQKIRKRNKAYALPGEPAGQQTSNRRAERSSTRGVKKEKGAKSAFGTMRHVGGPYKEEVDIYDIILSHLLDEGYAETPEAAEAIMVNMSEEWRDVIVEAAVDWDMSSDEMEKARNERKFGKQGFNQAGQTQLRRRLHKSERGMKKQDVRRWNGEK
jgi:hypothetical protein